MGKDRLTIGPADVVYVAGGQVHQFCNPHTEPFGFFCIVDAHRDPPQITCCQA